MTRGRSVGLAIPTCGALALTTLACVSSPTILYAAESRELIHAKNKGDIWIFCGC